jgi:hypothetical protein
VVSPVRDVDNQLAHFTFDDVSLQAAVAKAASLARSDSPPTPMPNRHSWRDTAEEIMKEYTRALGGESHA